MQFDKSFDVLVAGAGVAGVAAALEAARAGYRVCLVEKTVLLGGLATTGLIHVYLPLCDGCGHQVTAGLSEELFHLSYKYGPGGVPPTWRNPEPKPGPQRYRTLFSPASFNLAMDEALEQAGVEIWLDTLICQTVMEGDRAAGVEVENKSGRGVLRARMIVDATGDADVAFRAGAPCRESGNWLSIWVLEISLEAARQAVAANSGENLFKHTVHSEGGGRELAPPDGGYRGTDGRNVTRIVMDGRRKIRDIYKAKHAAGAGRQDVYPIALPAMPTFRTTRCIQGLETVLAGHDGVGKPTSTGLAADWRRPGPVWEIPYGALVPQKVTGLLAAGRCMSAEGDAWHVTRVIPCAALTGQLAGMAAVLCLQRGIPPAELDPRAMQDHLASRNLPFHLEHAGLPSRPEPAAPVKEEKMEKED